MRRIMIGFAVAIAAALAGAGPAAASGTPQSPQSQTFLVSCPNMAPFLATSPTPPSAAGVGQPMAIIPDATFRGRIPSDRVMTCTLFPQPSGTSFTSQILIAPTTH
jgi:hypothetical protein